LPLDKRRNLFPSVDKSVWWCKTKILTMAKFSMLLLNSARLKKKDRPNCSSIYCQEEMMWWKTTKMWLLGRWERKARNPVSLEWGHIEFLSVRIRSWRPSQACLKIYSNFNWHWQRWYVPTLDEQEVKP
jgi:hypothetical protein